MEVNDPVFRFVSQAGKLQWLYTAIATWVLGFATWQVLYLVYSSVPFAAPPSGLPGPNSFVSVVLGDGLALPILNALIVHFYTLYCGLDTGLFNKRPTMLGGGVQAVIALLFAAVSTVGTYVSWFAARKVDWTIPQPGVLNYAGIYHVVFVTAETFFVVNFAISVGRILIASREGAKIADSAIPLMSLLGGIWLAVDVFLLALLVDGLRNLIPLLSYESAAITAVLSIVIGISAAIVTIYRSQVRILLERPVTVLLLFLAFCGALIPFITIHLR